MKLEDLKVGDCFALHNSMKESENRWHMIVDKYDVYDISADEVHVGIRTQALNGKRAVFPGELKVFRISHAGFVSVERDEELARFDLPF